MSEVALATKQLPPNFFLELLNRSAERRLGDVAGLSRAGEI
jgi:hypothetical protein